MQPKPQTQPTPARGTTTTMALTPASLLGKPTMIRLPDSTPTGALISLKQTASANPYRGDEIRMLSTGLNKTGRPIVLSLSPGPSPFEKIDELRKYSQMWRISNDIWDLWHGDRPYPQGVGDQFA